MGGGKGGESTTTVEIPEELKAGATGALAGALRSASLGYRPNQGITIAALAPQQRAAMAAANQGAGAFGLPTGGGSYLPQAQMGAGGVRGYSTGDLYKQNVGLSMSAADQRARQGILEGYGRTADEIEGQYTAGKGSGGSIASTPATATSTKNTATSTKNSDAGGSIYSNDSSDPFANGGSQFTAHKDWSKGDKSGGGGGK